MTDTVTMTLSEFLLARIAEDEGAAKRVIKVGRATLSHMKDTKEIAAERLLRECAAKRGIAESYGRSGGAWGHGRTVLGHLASVYSDHPDYDPAWALDGAA